MIRLGLGSGTKQLPYFSDQV